MDRSKCSGQIVIGKYFHYSIPAQLVLKNISLAVLGEDAPLKILLYLAQDAFQGVRHHMSWVDRQSLYGDGGVEIVVTMYR